MRPVRNIILDFDGTISDSREDIASAQLWALGQVGFAGATKEDLYPHIGKPLTETFLSVPLVTCTTGSRTPSGTTRTTTRRAPS